MKEKDREPVHTPEDPQEDLVRRLLKLSGERPAIAEEVAARVHSSVHSHWKKSLRSRTRTRMVLIIAGSLAASFLLFFFASNFDQKFIPINSQVASLEAHTGELILGGKRLSSSGTQLFENSTLETGKDGRALFRTVKGVTLRLDVESRVRFDSESSFILERGAIYLDSENTHSKFNVSTPLGDISNQGTQFEVRLQQRAMEVRVREGSISLTNEKSLHSVTAGNRLSIDARGQIVRSEFATYGPSWDWISHVSPVFHLEGRTLTEFLTWITHENGWSLSLPEAQFQQSHGRVVLHGSIENLSPGQMLEAVLPVCGLRYSLDAGVLKVNPTERK